jgi:hypothetical protein
VQNKFDIKEKIPGTDEHAVTHPHRGTGGEGVKNAVKEHMPGQHMLTS